MFKSSNEEAVTGASDSSSRGTELAPLLLTPAGISPVSGVSVANNKQPRILSLDTFRGLVILQSLILPMVGHFNQAAPVFKHSNSFFSMADSTSVIFYVAIGFAMQLTLSRLRSKEGLWAMLMKQLKRCRE